MLNLSDMGYCNPKMVVNHWRTVERYRVSIVGDVPTTLGAVGWGLVDAADLASIRIGYTGGAPVPAALQWPSSRRAANLWARSMA